MKVKKEHKLFGTVMDEEKAILPIQCQIGMGGWLFIGTMQWPFLSFGWLCNPVVAEY